MADTDMTPAERDAFLAGLHVGVLAIERDGKGPLAVPIWYQYEDGDVLIWMSDESAKARLLRRHGRASMTVQDESPPYRYVMVEGPVTVEPSDRDITPVAIRYLGEEMGRGYGAQNPPTESSVIARLTPEHWLTTDYGKPG